MSTLEANESADVIVEHDNMKGYVPVLNYIIQVIARFMRLARYRTQNGILYEKCHFMIR